MVNKFEERAAWVATIRESVASGAIETASRATLTEYSTWLCNPLARSAFSGDSEFEQISELVRLHMLRSMIDSFEDRSKIIQRWLLFFAVLAIVATLMPYIIQPIPILGAKPSPTESAARTGQGSSPTQASTTSIPTPAPPPSSGQVVKQGTVKAAKATP
jgi:hypothetical protein